MNFSGKQKNLMMTLGFVSDLEQYRCYEDFCALAVEMRAKGLSGKVDFTDYLKNKVFVAVEQAKEKNAEALMAI